MHFFAKIAVLSLVIDQATAEHQVLTGDSWVENTLKEAQSEWITAVDIQANDPELGYKSDQWSSPTPTNAAIKPAYTATLVTSVRFTMNEQTRIFELQDADQGKFTLQQLFTGPGRKTKPVWQPKIQSDKPFIDGLNDSAENLVCQSSMGFNVRDGHGGSSEARFGAQLDEGCQTNAGYGSAFGIGLFVGNWYSISGNGYARWNGGNKIHDQLAAGIVNCCREQDHFLVAKLEVRALITAGPTFAGPTAEPSTPGPTATPTTMSGWIGQVQANMEVINSQTQETLQAQAALIKTQAERFSSLQRTTSVHAKEIRKLTQWAEGIGLTHNLTHIHD